MNLGNQKFDNRKMLILATVIESTIWATKW